jgi:hypothetical protein
MKLSNNVSILPWYDSIEDQNHNREYANYGIFPLFAVNNILPPFQIAIPDRQDLPWDYIDIYMDAHIINSQSQPINCFPFSNTQMRRVPVLADGYIQIINDGLLPITSVTTLTGRVYISLLFVYRNEFNAAIYQFYLFSEIVTFVSSDIGLVKLEYWDNQPFIHTYGQIMYASPYKNFVYLNTQVGKPEYIFEEEVSKRDGYNFIEKQISEKRFKFEFIAPEFLCDALRIVRMHDNINITNIDGTIYNVESILINPKWQEVGDIAVVDVEFECDTVIKKIGKRFTPILINDDFGADFNTDFNNNTI